MAEQPGVRETWGRYSSKFASERADLDQRPPMRRLLELCALAEGSLVLDVATGAGFTAFAFGSVGGCRMVALDPTHEMLLATQEGWRERGLPGEARTVEAWAEFLPFRDATFDAVVSHRAPHQFADQPAFVREARRILRPGGVLGVADQSPPDGFEDWHNDVERLRDPTHEHALSPRQWRAIVDAESLDWETHDVVFMPHDLQEWMDRVDCAPDRQGDIIRAFEEIPDDIRAVYNPELVDDRLKMRTPQLVFVARR